jgi:competence protein ComEA
MKWLQEYFEMRRWEAISIVLLIAAIIASVAINYSIPYLVEKDLDPQKKLELIRLTESLDSSNGNRKSFTQNDGSNIKPHKFNPSTCDKAELLSLGLSEKTADMMLNYRSKGGQFRTKQDVQKMYSLSDAEYVALEAYIDLPDKSSSNSATYSKKEIAIVDLNTCDTAQLNKLPGIGAYTAQRIVDYRNKLGGFISTNQILECGITEANYSNAKAYMSCNKKNVKYINLSSISFQELRTHPYCNEAMALAICKYRKKQGAITNVSELNTLEGIDLKLLAKLQPYLTLQ